MILHRTIHYDECVVSKHWMNYCESFYNLVLFIRLDFTYVNWRSITSSFSGNYQKILKNYFLVNDSSLSIMTKCQYGIYQQNLTSRVTPFVYSSDVKQTINLLCLLFSLSSLKDFFAKKSLKFSSNLRCYFSFFRQVVTFKEKFQYKNIQCKL